MTLSPFDVRGVQVKDDKSEKVIRNGDPRRSLLRYGPDGREQFVHARINMALLRAAVALPVLILEPVSRKDELMPVDDLLTPEGSMRNFQFFERMCENVAGSPVPACYIAERHGQGRRDFYFVTEDVAGFERIARTAAEALAFPLTIERRRLAELAPIILPTEAIGELGIEVAVDARIRPTRFEFWGSDQSLASLRAELERREYRFLGIEPSLRELRMLKSVRIDGRGFRAVLKELVPLARSLGCSYRGTETVEGYAQFLLTRPLPERYAADPSSGAGFFRGIFGHKGS